MEYDAENDEVDVIPIGDEREHVFGAGCWCRPKVELIERDGAWKGVGKLYAHNSSDCREMVEEAEFIKAVTERLL